MRGFGGPGTRGEHPLVGTGAVHRARAGRQLDDASDARANVQAQGQGTSCWKPIRRGSRPGTWKCSRRAVHLKWKDGSCPAVCTDGPGAAVGRCAPTGRQRQSGDLQGRVGLGQSVDLHRAPGWSRRAVCTDALGWRSRAVCTVSRWGQSGDVHRRAGMWNSEVCADGPG